MEWLKAHQLSASAQAGKCLKDCQIDTVTQISIYSYKQIKVSLGVKTVPTKFLKMPV